MEEEEEEAAADPFAIITQHGGILPNPQIQILRNLRFLHEEEEEEEEEMYHTPEEQLSCVSSEEEEGISTLHQHQGNKGFVIVEDIVNTSNQQEVEEASKKRKFTLHTNASSLCQPQIVHQGLAVICAEQRRFTSGATSGAGDGDGDGLMHTSVQKPQDVTLQKPLEKTNACSLPAPHGFLRKLPDWPDQFGRKQTSSFNSLRGVKRCDPELTNVSVTNRISSSSLSVTDLVDPNEDDLLVTAIKAGWNIPRPRYWRS